MTKRQRPIGSGFGYRSTAAEVLRGLDLSGRLALVTGGYSGIGLATSRALHEAGATVLVPARRPEQARRALAGLDRVEIAALDLAEQRDIRAFAEGFLAQGRGIDIAIGSAGLMECPETRVGPGWEAQFAVNHLGHFALFGLLWPALARGGGARVVLVSSLAHHFSDIRWADPQFTTGYDRTLAYGQAKTANVLCAVRFDAIGAEHGIRAFAVHPGPILTGLQRHLSRAEMIERGWVDAEGTVVDPDFKTPEQGAATQVWAATAPRLREIGGVYCEDCEIAEPAPQDGTLRGVRSYALDPAAAQRLEEYSAGLIRP
ncbi:SDR family NAD(P)-dependent oxidoreductase [Sciscionella sediminilitoris]|uniref:SDR family NAD(P)-dependent oxidoreductase n=1 Tax=Sciscionella sediminilitoris TaxID=1445613 RepID=UPI0004DF217D|nr:SDR family NAD(P)-dependent oxidoreductase [Sciscionella sp. SE31]